MTGAWITDIRHFLDEHGGVCAGLPAVPRHMGAIVEAASTNPPGKVFPLDLRCRRRPDRQRCPGSVHASIDRDTAEIAWYCPCCGDHGCIHNWHGSPWDRRSVGSGSLAPAPEPAGFSPRAVAAWNRIPPVIRVRLLNNFWCGTCLGEASVELKGGVVSGGNLILRGNCTTCGGEIARLVEGVGGA